MDRRHSPAVPKQILSQEINPYNHLFGSRRITVNFFLEHRSFVEKSTATDRNIFFSHKKLDITVNGLIIC